MKNVIKYFFFLSLSPLFTSAQVVNIPQKAQDSFIKTYPNSKNVKWVNNATNYVAKFDDEGGKFQAHYNVDGTWDFTEKELDKDKLPGQVKSTYDKSAKNDWFIESGAYIENSKKEKLYRLGIKKGIQRKYIFYDTAGKEVRETLTL